MSFWKKKEVIDFKKESHETVIFRILKGIEVQIDVLIKNRGLSAAEDYQEELREKADKQIEKILPVIRVYSKQNEKFWASEVVKFLNLALGKDKKLEDKKKYVQEAIKNLAEVLQNNRKAA